MDELALIRRDRGAAASPGQEARARYVGWLREPVEQLDFAVDGVLLSERLRTLEVPQPDVFGLDPFDLLSVVDLAWPREAASALRQLAGVEARSADWPLEPGRLPLYVCTMCADLGCGAVTVEVLHQGDVVSWRDLRVEDGHTDQSEMIDLSALGPMTFDAEHYRAVLLEPVPVLQALADDERAAERRWKDGRGLRGIVRRLRGAQPREFER